MPPAEHASTASSAGLNLPLVSSTKDSMLELVPVMECYNSGLYIVVKWSTPTSLLMNSQIF